MDAYSSFSTVEEKESDSFGETKILRMIITKATPTIVSRFSSAEVSCTIICREIQNIITSNTVPAPGRQSILNSSMPIMISSTRSIKLRSETVSVRCIQKL